jgi:glyoxylase-like metal-dependent hydrolase (beta-lactamase superfamily II)
MIAAKAPPSEGGAYPANKASPVLSTDFENRTVTEINQEKFDLKAGSFPAFDYFGDGSFFLLDCPGHAVGHMCGLARTSSDESEAGHSFIFMGADTCHHGGEYRPSKYVELPEQIRPNPFNRSSPHACPCGIFEHVHRDPESYRSTTFYTLKGTTVSEDVKIAEASIAKLQEFDASSNVLVVCAHDRTLEGVVDVFPKTANGWRERGWKEEARWAFLGDWDIEGAPREGKNSNI